MRLISYARSAAPFASETLLSVPFMSDELDVNVGHELGLIIAPVTVFLPGHTTPIQRLSDAPFVQFCMRGRQAAVRTNMSRMCCLGRFQLQTTYKTAVVE